MSFQKPLVKVVTGKPKQIEELEELKIKCFEQSNNINELNKIVTSLSIENENLKKHLEEEKHKCLETRQKSEKLLEQFEKIKEKFIEVEKETKEWEDKEQQLIGTISIMQDEINFLNQKVELLRSENEIYSEEIKETDKIKSRIEDNLINVFKNLEETKGKSKVLENIIKKKDQHIDFYKKNDSRYYKAKVQVEKLSKNLNSEDGCIEQENPKKDLIIKNLQRDLEKKDFLIKQLEKEKNTLFVRLKSCK